MFDLMKRFLQDEDGPTAVEYAVMISMIIVVCFGAIGLLGEHNADRWDGNSNSIGSAIDDSLS